MKKFYLLLIAFCAITQLQAQIVSTTTGGDWSQTTTWQNGVVPTASDDVVITNGSTVGINTTANCTNLTVDGTLHYFNVANITLTASGNITIANDGTFTAGSGDNSNLFVGGNFINNGIFIGEAGSNHLTTTFTGAGNNVFTTSPTSQIINLGPVIINKGADASSILDFNPDESSSIVLGSSYSMTLTTGTLKISGTRLFTDLRFAGTSIHTNSRLWFNNGSVNVDLTILTSISGSLQLDAGKLSLGTISGPGLVAINGGAVSLESVSGAGTATITGGTVSAGTISGAWDITINGGIINCAGSMNTSGKYAQSAGAITVATSSNSGNNIPSFGVSGNSFTMSGGSIVLQTVSKGIPKSDYSVSTPSPVITGGTLTLGNSSTFTLGSDNAFNVQGTTPSLRLLAGSGFATVSVTQTGPLTVAGDLALPDNTFNSGFELQIFDKGNFSLTIKGNSAANPGNIYIGLHTSFTINGSATPANALFFTSLFGNQTLTNNGTITNMELPSITVNNNFSNGIVTIPAGLSMISNSRLTLFNGKLNAGASLGLGTSVPGTFTCIRFDGALTAGSVSFGTGITSSDYSYNASTSNTSMGPELTTDHPFPSISSLTVNNPKGITLNSDLVVTASISFTNGVIANPGNHKLTLSSNVPFFLDGGSSSSFLNGGVFERVQSGNAGDSYFYPIGTGGKFRPVRLVNSAVTGGNTFDVSYHSGAPAVGAVAAANGFRVSVLDNWEVAHVSSASANEKFNVSLITDNNTTSGIADRSTVVVGHYNTATAKWDNLVQQTNPNFNTTGSEIVATNVTNFSPFSFMSNVLANTLPILIHSFNVVVNKNTAGLTWNIEFTSGAAVYIQHSADGLQYADIAHFSNGIATNSFTDVNPVKGVNYYRLKLIEADGSVVYSAVKKVQFNSADNVILYPNPSTSTINVNWNNGQLPVNITIINNTGIALYNATVTGSQKTIDVTKFAAGQYILIHRQGDMVKHIPFVVIK